MASESLSGGTVSIPVKPDAEGFGKATSTGISDELRGQGSALGGIGHSISKAILATAGIAIAAGIGAVIKVGIGEAMDASAGMAQLKAGIASTAGIAGVTADHLQELASTIQNYSGITDDSVVATEQLLLTFTNIRNVGPDKIFDDATKAAADMASKIPQYLGNPAAAATALGKALNDPLLGITALSKVGVSFTKEQKDQVAALLQTGNVVGAQKIILGELTKEYGGAAKAAGQSLPGQLAIGKRAFEDFSQEIVEDFIPIVLPLVKRLTELLKDIAPHIKDAAKAFSDFLGSDSVQAFGKWISDNAQLLLGIVGAVIALAAAYEALKIAQSLATAAQWLLNIALDANPIGIIILAVGAFIALMIVWAGWVNDHIGLVAKLESSYISAFANILDVVDNVSNGMMTALLAPINLVRGLINLPPITFHMDLAAVARGYADALQSLSNAEANPNGSGVKSKGAKALADGGTIAPSSGGTMVKVAEAGRSETVVDTATLQAAMSKNKGGDTFNVYETTNPYATAVQISRVQNLRWS